MTLTVMSALKYLNLQMASKLWVWLVVQSGVKQLRHDLIDLYHWSNEWLMLLNTDKCNKYKVMNLGNNNPCVKCELGGQELETILEEKD